MKTGRAPHRRITTKTPAVFLFMLDLSGSMLEQIPFNGKLRSKAEILSLMINRTLGEILNRSLRENGYRDYFKIAIFGYYLCEISYHLYFLFLSLYIKSQQEIHPLKLVLILLFCQNTHKLLNHRY